MSDFLEEWPIPECQVEVVGNTTEDIAKRVHQNYLYQRQKDPIVKVAIQKTLTKLSQGQKLTLINTVTCQTFDSESDTIKEEIFTAAEQLHEEQAEAAQCSDQSPEDYLDAIDTAPTLLNQLLQDLAMQTGWWFTIICRGPDPADNGNIHTGRSK
ncbi:hypothetical protein IW262DRAFT_1296665 [Armillaria fumosa]|nr:hypothetical protein IW262DRAFT_1296665 [Armillaria fumosa]